MKSIGFVLLCALVFCSQAFADYIITPLSDGSSSITVAPGDSFDLDIVVDYALVGDSDVSMSAIFQVIFSSEGLNYKDYAWGAPYLTGGPDGTSDPQLPELATLLDTNSYPSTPSVVDAYMSNSLDDAPWFTTGLLVTLTLEVPSDYFGPDIVTIGVEPDQFFNPNWMPGGDESPLILATAGDDFTLTIVPEPSALLLLAPALLGIAGVVRRRMRR